MLSSLKVFQLLKVEYHTVLPEYYLAIGDEDKYWFIPALHKLRSHKLIRVVISSYYNYYVIYLKSNKEDIEDSYILLTVNYLQRRFDPPLVHQSIFQC